MAQRCTMPWWAISRRTSHSGAVGTGASRPALRASATNESSDSRKRLEVLGEVDGEVDRELLVLGDVLTKGPEEATTPS